MMGCYNAVPGSLSACRRSQSGRDSRWHHEEGVKVMKFAITLFCFSYSGILLLLKGSVMEGFYVYAIVSEKDGTIYVGISKDFKQRLKEHNRGKSKYTKGHIPWRLFYTEYARDSVAARLKEKYYKSGAGKKRLKGL